MKGINTIHTKYKIPVICLTWIFFIATIVGTLFLVTLVLFVIVVILMAWGKVFFEIYLKIPGVFTVSVVVFAAITMLYYVLKRFKLV